MSAYLSPVFNEPQVDANGNPLSGGKVFAFAAGSGIPATTYTSNTGTVAQTNPIILNSRGVPDNPIWLAGGIAYKFFLQDANGVTLAPSLDNVQGINDPSAVTAQDQWVTFAATPTFLSATSFSVSGDQTPTLQVGRRLKTANSSGVIYSTILRALFSSGVTTVTVANDSSTPLDSGLSSVSYGLLSPLNSSIPNTVTGSHNRIINAATVISQFGAKSLAASGSLYGGADQYITSVFATTVSAVVQQVASPVAGIGQAGFCQNLTLTTTTGTTSFAWSQRIESKNVIDLNSQTVTFSARVYQATGSPVVFTPSLSKATALDNFTSTTVVTAGAPITVASHTVTTVSVTVTLGPADASNGLQCTVTSASMAAQSGSQWYTSDWWFDVGTAAPTLGSERSNATAELLRCQRYYYDPPACAAGFSPNTTTAAFSFVYPTPMRAVPTFSAKATTSSISTTLGLAAIAGTWTASTIGSASMVAVFTRGAGTFTAGDGALLNDSTGTSPFTLSSVL